MKKALLEIGVEHLPARFVAPALSQLAANAAKMLEENRLRCSGVEVHGTMRRLAVILNGVAEKSESVEKTSTGPPARFLKNEDGCFTPQALGFAKAQGVSPESLETASTPKGEFLQARRTIAGEPAMQVLTRVFPALIESLQFPKSMEWEESHLRFARPIRNIVALYGNRVVSFSVAGIQSGNKSPGLSVASRPINIADPDGYIRKLRDECILVEVDERRSALSKALDQAVRNIGGGTVLDKDAALFDETVYLTEHPIPVIGKFDADFLKLPQALLTTVLKKQLKFFPIFDSHGKLHPSFAGVRDGISEGQETVRDGYERVLAARFSDARFFHRRDHSSPLRVKVDLLRKVAFHKGLGTMHDQMERTVELSIWICGFLWRKRTQLDLGAVESIARLAYADLVTEVVHEFPELQGAMGGHYARLDGERERVALGIEEFYYPVSAKSPLPTHLEGCVVSMAGKMDKLAAMFLAGLKPTGSEDPFALRRAGTGIIRTALEKQLPISLTQLASQACRLVTVRRTSSQSGSNDTLPADAAERFDENMRDFLWQRAESCFQEMDYLPDEIRAVEDGGLDDIPRTFRRLTAVHALRSNPEFGELATAFKRASNLLKQAGAATSIKIPIDRALISTEAENALFGAMHRAEKLVLERVAHEDYEKALKDLVQLKPFVDRFFEEVRVMDSEEHVKKNRLAILSQLVSLFRSIADISHIQAAPTVPAPARAAN